MAAGCDHPRIASCSLRLRHRAGALGAEVDEDARDTSRLGRLQLRGQRRGVAIDHHPRSRTAEGGLQLREAALRKFEDIDEARIARLARNAHLLGLLDRRREGRDFIEIAVVVQRLEDRPRTEERVGAVGDHDLACHHQLSDN